MPALPRSAPRRFAAGALAACALAVAAAGWPSAASAQQPDQPWLDAARAPDQRADLLVAQMTLEQKVSLFSPQPNDPIPELGVPRRRERDGCCGLSMPRSLGVPTTAMPLGISLASTFDADLARDYGRQIGRETWLTGYTAITSPNADLARSPFFGRLNESFGEDPLLNARLPVAVTQGVQESPVYALPKHYVLNLQESRRNVLDQQIDERTLRELYLRPWEAIVKQGDPGAIMCSFPRIRGEYACSSRHILQEVLKDEWGFRGWVSSDFNACHDFADFEDGVDICGPATYFGPALRAAVESGVISRARFDDMVHRVLRTLFARGIFDAPPPGALDPANPPSQPLPVDVLQEGEQLARQVGAAGVVLLKNADRQLPLQRSELDSIAVIGGDADWYIDGVGSPAVPNPAILTTTLDGIAERAGGNVTVEHAPGTDPGRIGDTLGGPPPVPSGVLSPAGSDDPDARGLRGQFWIGPPQGDPFLTRTDDQVNVRTGLAGLVASFGLDTSKAAPLPVPLLAAPLMSARWSGTLTPAETGSYTLALTHLGSATLRIDGAAVVSDPGTTYGTRTAQLDLVAGNDYAVQLDYAEDAPGQCCITDATSPGPLVRFAWTPPSAAASPQIQEAVDLAAASDVAVVVARTFEGESHDRQSLTLPQDQDRLIAAVAAANPATVVVLATGGPVTMPWLRDVPAVLEAWYAGEAQGRAVADVLFGDENPGGKLPVTFPASDDQPEQLGIENPFWQFPDPSPTTTYDEGVFIGYRGYDERRLRPLFPFGHGLSYTRFHYANVRTTGPRVARGRVRASDGAVRVQIRNVGDETGTEVVQVYHGRLPGTNQATPPQQLLGWARATLDPDERQTVTVPIDIDGPEHPLSYWNDRTGRFVVPTGEVQIRAGSSSRDIRRTTRMTIR